MIRFFDICTHLNTFRNAFIKIIFCDNITKKIRYVIKEIKLIIIVRTYYELMSDQWIL